MSHVSIRLWFCLAVAVIGAAIADPLVEHASNAGWFGTGNFTDHSYLDVVPGGLAGLVLLALQVTLKILRSLRQAKAPRLDLWRVSDDALDCGLVKLLPLAFGLQLIALYAMETCEQLSVLGHVDGATVWLGGPVLVSLAAHAIACIAVTFALARLVRVLARATLHVLRGLHAVRLRAYAPAAAWTYRPFVPLALPLRSLRCIGERAPPLLAV